MSGGSAMTEVKSEQADPPPNLFGRRAAYAIRRVNAELMRFDVPRLFTFDAGADIADR